MQDLKTHMRRNAAWPALLVLSMLSMGAQAEGPELSGDGSLGIWSSTRMLDDSRGVATARVRLELDWQPSDALQFSADALLLSAPERLDGQRQDAQLTEFYVKARDLPCAPALGKRLVLWGRADALNPTDQVSPVQYRRMTPRSADQRDGRWGVHLDCLAGNGRFQVHALDGFEFNEIPFDTSSPVVIRQPSPDVGPSVALKYDRLGASADWSISAIDSHDLFPTLELDPLAGPVPTLDLVPTRMRMLGGDVAMARGNWVFRGEIARTLLSDTRSPLVAKRYSSTSSVAGAERALGDRETVSMQAFWKRLDSAPGVSGSPLLDPLQQAQGLVSNEIERDQYGVTFRYAKPLFESRADMDILGIWGLSGDDWLVRGRLRHSISDSIRISTGFDVYRGPASSYLGNLRRNSLAFVELDYLW